VPVPPPSGPITTNTQYPSNLPEPGQTIVVNPPGEAPGMPAAPFQSGTR
jgi:hypothetical protein